MEEENIKEISNEIPKDSTQKKKRKKKKHKKNSAQQQSHKEENGESKIESIEITEENVEIKLKSNEINETPEENIQNQETTNLKDDNNTNFEEIINNNKKEDIKEEINEIESTENTKKHKGKKKKGKKIKKKKEEINDELKEETLDDKNEEKEKDIQDSNIKNENNILEENNEKIDNNDIEINKEIYPEKDIDPMNLIIMDEDDGEIDYLKAEQIYELSVFLESHKFIRNIKKFDSKFINLVKRHIIRYEKNLYELTFTNKFFILYELIITANPGLCLSDILLLDTIKSILISYPDSHLIIIISDEDFLNTNNKDNEYDDSLIEKYSKEKLSNIITYIDLNSEKEKNIHVFSSKLLSKKEAFVKQKNNFKNTINKKRLKKLFNSTSNKDDINILDYPCTLSLISNPLFYTEYIPEITSEYKCLIINSIFYMNRYQLCFSASKYYSFPESSIIALKILPPLTGVNGQESNFDIKEENIILSTDDDSTLEKKMKEIAHEDKEKNINLDIGCQYLYFLEDNNENYNNMIEDYESGKLEHMDINERCLELIKEKFNIFKNKDIKDFDVNKFFVDLNK